MFISRLNQILEVLSRHWESESRKGDSPDVKAIACALKAEQLSHSTGGRLIDLRTECMESFGVRRYSSVDRAAQVLERASPDRIADVFAGRITVGEALATPKYTVKIQQPNLIEGDSGMEDSGSSLVPKRGRKKVVRVDHYTPEQLAHSGARKLLNFEHRVGFLKETDVKIPVENRIFRYVCKTVFDAISGESLRGGDILRLDELVYEKTIYPTQRTRTDGGFEKCKREVKEKLPSVHRAFNFWLNESTSPDNSSAQNCAILPKKKDGEIIGLIIPNEQTDVDAYFLEQRRRRQVAVEGITIVENRIKGMISGGSTLQLPSGDDDDDNDKAAGAAA